MYPTLHGHQPLAKPSGMLPMHHKLINRINPINLINRINPKSTPDQPNLKRTT
jgi:hypothetical protein